MMIPTDTLVCYYATILPYYHRKIKSEKGKLIRFRKFAQSTEGIKGIYCCF